MLFKAQKSAVGTAQQHALKFLGIFALATAGFSMDRAMAVAAVTLAWNANPESDITGYQLSYGTSPGLHPSVINPGTNTTASVSGLTEGTTYYFVVSAINQAGLQSLPSGEVSYQVPAAPTNRAPVATSSSLTTAQGTPLPITLGGSDADGDALSFAIVSGPANGTLSGTAPNLTYNPAANFSGADQFTFLVNDGKLNSNVATVSISVNAPAAAGVVNGSFESGFTGWSVTGNAFIESASSPYTATDGVKLASFNGNSTSDSAPDAVLSQVFATTAGATYTLAFDMGVIGSASGEQKLQVTVDGAGNLLSQIASKSKLAGGSAQWTANSYSFVANSAATTLTFRDISAVTNGIDTLLDNVRVTGPPAGSNTAPVAVADSYSTTVGTALVISAAGVLANDTDAQANPLTAVLDAGPSRGSLTLNANGGFSYTPAVGYAGTDSFTYHANDGFLNSASVTVSITVIQVNSAPVASSKAVTTAENTPLPITLSASDPDGNSLTFSVLAAPTQGTLTGTAPNLTYSPSANFNGADQFTFRVNDGTVNSATATVSITVTAVNDAPLATAKSVTTAQGTSLPITLAGTDVDGNTLTFSIVSSPANGTLGGTAPNLIYNPAANFSGTDQFTFKVNDGTVDSATATVSIVVTPANSLPLPWNVYQLGTGNLAGTASYGAGVYTIAGSGALGGTQDAANFSWQTLSGDGDITARISNLNDTGTATRVGVMIRESLATSSRQVFIGVDNTGTFQWLRRTSTGGSMSTTTSKVLATSNQWVRLTRTGNTLTSYKSSDGTTWTRIGASKVTLPTNCYIGLSVSSGSNTVLNTSQFSDVSVTP